MMNYDTKLRLKDGAVMAVFFLYFKLNKLIHFLRCLSIRKQRFCPSEGRQKDIKLN